MKLILLITLVSLGAQAMSINPERIVTPFIEVYSSKNKILGEQVEARVTTYNKHGDLKKGKGKLTIPLTKYQQIRSQSAAVFRMIADGTHNKDNLNWKGTAFHIGHNLVLTNHHVLSPDRENSTECANFELHDNQSKHVFPCQTIHYCNADHDVCLIEMGESRLCKGFFCKKKEFKQLKDGAALRINPHPQVVSDQRETIVMTAIGNPMGHGIHYSQGRGLSMTSFNLYFYAPVRTGNSGGPLLGDDGLVWGVIKAESQEKVGPKAYNAATTSDKVIELMKENLDSETFEKFSSAIVQPIQTISGN